MLDLHLDLCLLVSASTTTVVLFRRKFEVCFLLTGSVAWNALVALLELTGNCYSDRTYWPDIARSLHHAHGLIGTAEPILFTAQRVPSEIAVVAPRSSFPWDAANAETPITPAAAVAFAARLAAADIKVSFSRTPKVTKKLNKKVIFGETQKLFLTGKTFLDPGKLKQKWC